ncbi:MAG: hypothetical protein AMXMBFR84_19940 [Candidatus Hydrogenedentota bacterium]
MRIQTFMGKVGVEGLTEMDEHINQWLAQHNVEPKHISQAFGQSTSRDGSHTEPVLIVSLWY